MTDLTMQSFFDELEKIGAHNWKHEREQRERRRKRRARVGAGLAVAGGVTAAGLYGGPKLKAYAGEMAADLGKRIREGHEEGIVSGLERFAEGPKAEAAARRFGAAAAEAAAEAPGKKVKAMKEGLKEEAKKKKEDVGTTASNLATAARLVGGKIKDKLKG